MQEFVEGFVCNIHTESMLVRRERSKRWDFAEKSDGGD
jgi:hypothetical protein